MGTPTLPGSPPLMRIYDAAGSVKVSKLLPIGDRYNSVGLFATNVFLSGLFVVGLYTVTYTYAIGSFNGMASDTFEVIDGGNADGAVESMHYWRQPQGDFIVYQLSSGQIAKGRSPVVI